MTHDGPLAQPVEHRPFKAGVVGSNPTRLTIENRDKGVIGSKKTEELSFP